MSKKKKFSPNFARIWYIAKIGGGGGGGGGTVPLAPPPRLIRLWLYTFIIITFDNTEENN